LRIADGFELVEVFGLGGTAGLGRKGNRDKRKIKKYEF
jgi:hypothetical protein